MKFKKNPTTSLEIETANFPLVAECLNKLRYSLPEDPHGSHDKQRLLPQTALTGWAL
jgi:hypothetical protein